MGSNEQRATKLIRRVSHESVTLSCVFTSVRAHKFFIYPLVNQSKIIVLHYSLMELFVKYARIALILDHITFKFP